MINARRRRSRSCGCLSLRKESWGCSALQDPLQLLTPAALVIGPSLRAAPQRIASAHGAFFRRERGQHSWETARTPLRTRGSLLERPCFVLHVKRTTKSGVSMLSRDPSDKLAACLNHGVNVDSA